MKIRYKILSLLIFLCGILIAVSAVADSGLPQNQPGGELIDRSDNPLPGGWVNVVNKDSIIINDTYYIVNGFTRYPDGKNRVVEGAFVEIEVKTENILSTIRLAKPGEEDMYMKPIVRSAGKNSARSQGEAEKENGTSNNSGMRLENGVWVN